MKVNIYRNLKQKWMNKMLYIKNFQIEGIVVDREEKGKKENLIKKVEDEGQEYLEKGGQKIKVNATAVTI